MLIYNLVLKSVTNAGKMTCLVKNKDAYLILYYINREEEKNERFKEGCSKEGKVGISLMSSPHPLKGVIGKKDPHPPPKKQHSPWQP